jgi:acyl carrier protein
VKEELRKFIIDNFLFGVKETPLSEKDSFLELGLIDSTGVLELVSFLEERYGIQVQDDELIPENLDSISSLERFLNQKMDKKVVALS